MSGLAERAGARAVAATVARLEDQVAAVLPQARVTRDGAMLTIVGRGVAAALPWPAGLLR